MVKIGINGFGRMGRLVAREIIKNNNYTLVAVNHPTIDRDNFNKLIKYDNVYGTFNEKMTDNIIIYNEKNPANIPWDYSLDIILDTTNNFKEIEDFENYNKGDNTKIIISTPSKTLPMFIYGVNQNKYNNEHIISAGSCTTTCLAPIVDILDTNYHIKTGFATMIHSTATFQTEVDKRKPKTRLDRNVLNNIIPFSTDVEFEIGKVLSDLNGLLNTINIGVPVQNVSLIDLTVELDYTPHIEDIIKELEYQAINKYTGIIKVDHNELVSCDYIGSPYTSIIDGKTIMKQGDLYKMLIWYDNEYGYIKNLSRLMNYIV